MTEPDNSRDAVGRSEWLLVALITLVGGAVRFYAVGREGLSHYDEGVYVLWAMGLEFPAKELFAPPLFPLLLRAVFALFGPSDLVAQATNAFIGTVTLPLVWGVSRRWFGRLAGLSALVLATGSGLHVAFSRTALTDVSFTFWFVLAGWLASELARRSEPGPGARPIWPLAVALGLAAGAAINTKYNGLLTLAIAAAPFIADAARGRVNRRLAVGLALAAVVAAAMYLPWFLHVNRSVDGGYSGLLRHHRGYSTGLSNFPQNLGTLMLGHSYLTYFTGRDLRFLVAGLIGVLGLVRACRLGLSVQSRALAALGGAAVGLALSCPVGWLAGLVFAGIELRNRSSWGAVMFAWLGVFMVLTPMYRPYARLLLPMEAASWIAGGGIVAALAAVATRTDTAWCLTGWATVLAAGVAGGAFVLPLGLPQPSHNGADCLARAATRVAQSIPDTGLVASFVRPPALFYVAHKHVRPVADLDWLGRPAQANEPQYLLIDEAILRDNPQAARRVEAARGILRQVTSVPYAPSAVVLLDDAGTELDQLRPSYSLTLYRIDRGAVSRETR